MSRSLGPAEVLFLILSSSCRLGTYTPRGPFLCGKPFAALSTFFPCTSFIKRPYPKRILMVSDVYKHA